MTDFIAKELDLIKTNYKTIEGAELITCVPAMVQIKIVYVPYYIQKFG